MMFEVRPSIPPDPGLIPFPTPPDPPRPKASFFFLVPSHECPNRTRPLDHPTRVPQHRWAILHFAGDLNLSGFNLSGFGLDVVTRRRSDQVQCHGHALRHVATL